MAQFINDWWLSNMIASESTEAQQNYFPLILNSELELSLSNFSTCMNADSPENNPVSFDGWDMVSIPTTERFEWTYAQYIPEFGYMITARDDYSPSSPQGRLMTSPTGEEWTMLDTPVVGEWWYKPHYRADINKLLVPMDGTGGNNVQISDDKGLTWSAITIGVGNDPVTKIEWVASLGLYVAMQYYSAILTSPDLVTWTAGTISTPGGYWDSPQDFVWAESLGLLVVVGLYGNVWTSADGLTWVHTILGGGTWDSFWSHLAWSEDLGLLVAQGVHNANYTQKDMFMSSTDGINWTQRPLGIALVNHHPTQSDYLPAYGIEWDEYTQLFYALTSGDDNNSFSSGSSLITPSMFLVTSPDAITWTIDTTVPSTHNFTYPVFGIRPYIGIAFKSATERILLNSHSVTYKL